MRLNGLLSRSWLRCIAALGGSLLGWAGCGAGDADICEPAPNCGTSTADAGGETGVGVEGDGGVLAADGRGLAADGGRWDEADGSVGTSADGDAALTDGRRDPTPCALRVVEGPAYTLSLEASGHLASLELSPQDYAAVARSCDPVSLGWAGVVASHFDDVFDFQIFVMDQEQSPDGATCDGRHIRIRNDIQGLGLPTITTTDFEAQPRLKSTIFLGRRWDIRSGNVMHEITHKWANALSTIELGSHWGMSDVHGNLGGDYESFQALGDGTYAAKVSSEYGFGAAGDLELYLMGLLPASEVLPVHWLRNAVYVDRNDGEQIWTADALVTTTIDDIIAADGPRVPEVSAAQREFRTLTIVVTRHPLPARRWSDQRRAIEVFAAAEPPASRNGTGTFFFPTADCACGDTHNFQVSVRGLASMDMSGVFDALLDSDARCVAGLPDTGSACADMLDKAKECGIPPSRCEVDTAYTPMVAACIGSCAEAASCEDIRAADQNPAGTSLHNTFTRCVHTCEYEGWLLEPDDEPLFQAP